MTHSYYDMVNESIRWHEQQIKDASDDIARVANNTTKFVAPASMEAELPQAELVAPGDACEPLAGVRVEAVPAYNPHKKFHPKANGWVGYVVTTLNGIRVYIAGDTDDLPQNRKIACDIALVPAGGTYTMDVREAATFINALKPADRKSVV